MYTHTHTRTQIHLHVLELQRSVTRLRGALRAKAAVAAQSAAQYVLRVRASETRPLAHCGGGDAVVTFRSDK